MKVAQKPSKLVQIRAPRRLDRFTAPPLFEDLESKVEKGICLAIDLSQTQVVDRVGAGVIREGFLRCKKNRTRLKLLGVKPAVKKALQNEGLLPRVSGN